MKTAKENQGAGSVDVDALLAAINEISESEVQAYARRSPPRQY
ncbi:cytoplasmic protein [Klebsiella michiganensis]|nr:cytoplasmic protein [Klebsiella michiganensis]